MKNRHFFRAFAIAMATAGMLLPQNQLIAADTARAAADASAPQVLDVALSARGDLHGQVVNAQGAPMADAEVQVRRGASQVAASRTDARGNFAVAGLQGGSYTVTAGQGGGVYRIWTAETAPPVARPGMLIVSGQQSARAQLGGLVSPSSLVVLGIAGGIVTAGVITTQHDSGS